MKVSGECSMSFKQYRDLYPIFAFDLTAQTMKVRNAKVQFTVIGTRNSNTPTNLNMYTVVLFEKFYEANYLANELKLRSAPMEIGVEGAGLFLN